MRYLAGRSAIDFDWQEYVREYGTILESPAGRRAATKLDPLLFGILYFRKHLTDKTTGTITFADLHLDMCRRARQWARKDLDIREIRDAWVAWRESGKSTWNFLILPAWALAHAHRHYVLAFADSGLQAQQHLRTFKLECETNALLRKDHPALVTPKRKLSGATMADRQDMYVTKNTSVFQARGVDSASLGLKFEDKRPDLILLDDIEPEESNYSEYQKGKRLHTVLNSIFPMNLRAAVSLTGTVTMANSIVHDLVYPVQNPKTLDRAPWPAEENFRVRWYPALKDPEGEPSSAHEARLPIASMLAPVKDENGQPTKKRWCDTAAFQLNYQNNARGKLGGWWTEDDFRYGTLEPSATRWMLQLDPAVTEGIKSDYTALVVAGLRPGTQQYPQGVVEIAYARQVKFVGEPMRKLVRAILAEFPRIKVVRVESNQGGQLWNEVLRDLPVPLDLKPSEDPKITRIAHALDWYQRARVRHTEKLEALESAQLNYPLGLHDDLPDCAALAVLYFLGKPPLVSVQQTTKSYLER